MGRTAPCPTCRAVWDPCPSICCRASSRWFMIEIRPSEAPWLFKPDGSSEWASTSAELLAFYAAVIAFEDEIYLRLEEEILEKASCVRPRSAPWIPLLRGWEGINQQQDAAEFLSFLNQRVKLPCYHGQWQARVHDMMGSTSM